MTVVPAVTVTGSGVNAFAPMSNAPITMPTLAVGPGGAAGLLLPLDFDLPHPARVRTRTTAARAPKKRSREFGTCDAMEASGRRASRRPRRGGSARGTDHPGPERGS